MRGEVGKTEEPEDRGNALKCSLNSAILRARRVGCGYLHKGVEIPGEMGEELSKLHPSPRSSWQSIAGEGRVLI